MATRTSFPLLVKLADPMKGYILAMQCGVRRREMRELMTCTSGDAGYDRVKQALRRLYWDFHQTTAGSAQLTSDEHAAEEEDMVLKARQELQIESDSDSNLDSVDENEASLVLMSYQEA